ncbi:MAG: beta strand repeat-containing protein, partial [Bacteroidota bacterium]
MSANLAITSTSVTGTDLRNNIFVNKHTFNVGGSFAYNIFLSFTGITFATSNNNDYAGTPSTNATYRVGWDGGTARATLNDWRSYTAQDLKSLAVLPVFVSASDLRLNSGDPTNATLFCGGTALAAVTDDIDCQIRKSFSPSMGADEVAVTILASIAVSETSGTNNDDGVICAGSSATLTASGGGSYSWSTGETSASISVSTAGTYTVTVTDPSGCVTTVSTSVTVNPNPIASISVTEGSGTTPNDAIICAGSTATLTASGGNTYLWSTTETTSSITVNPSSSETYSVIATNSDGCTNSSSTAITVKPLPTPSITGTNEICVGESSSFIANGGSNYLWSTGATSSAITVSLAGTYTVTATNADGCTASATRSLTVNALPTPTISIAESSGLTPNDGTICDGNSVTLTGGGGVSYSWSTGETSTAITVTPTSNTTYTVTATSSQNCSASVSSNVTVTPLPTASFAETQPTTCVSSDGSITVNPSGAGPFSYLWSTGATSQTISGLGVGSFSVTVTSTGTGCTVVASSNLIGPGGCDVCPTIASLSATPSPNCVNASTTLSTSGMLNLGNTYGINFVEFTTPTTSPYSGGTVIASVSNANLSAGGTSATTTTTFSTAGIRYIYAILSPAPTDPTCRPSVSTTLTVNGLPLPSTSITENSGVQPNDGILCAGANGTITASGASTYLWSTGATTSSISVGSAGSYVVTATDSNGCTATTSSTITVNPLPTPAISVTDNSGLTQNDGVICTGASASLTASGGNVFLWSTGATTATITTGIAGTYSVIVTNANGCSASTSSAITVNPLPTPTTSVVESSGTTANDGITCSGATVTITATGGTTYVWSTGATTAAITVNPVSTSTYTVTVTNANGCSATATRTVTVT